MAAGAFGLSIESANQTEQIILDGVSGRAMIEWSMPASSTEFMATATDGDIINDRIKIRVFGSGFDAGLALIRDMERLLGLAVLSQSNKSIERIYLDYTIDPTESYRSEIISGGVKYDRRQFTKGLWENEAFVITLELKRRYFFEAAKRQALSALSTHTETTTTPVTIYNPRATGTFTATFDNGNSKITAAAGLGIFLEGDVISINGSASNDGSDVFTIDSGSSDTELITTVAPTNEGPTASVFIQGALHNFVDISEAATTLGDQVGLSLPSPVEALLENQTGGDADYERVYIGHSATNTPGSLTYHYENLDMSFLGGSGSAVSSTASKFNHEVMPLGTTINTQIATFTISSADAGRMNGNYFAVIMRFNNAPATTQFFRLRVAESDTGFTVWTGPTIQLPDTERLHIIGTIPIPPGILYQVKEDQVGQYRSLLVAIEAWDTGSGTIHIDYVELFPMDSFRVIEQFGGVDIAANEFVVLNEYNTVDGQSMGQSGSASGFEAFDAFRVKGVKKLKLWPETDQRLYILTTENASAIASLTSLNMFWRPRKLTL